MTDLSNSILKNTYSLTELYRRLDLLQRFLEHSFFSESADKHASMARLREYYGNADIELRLEVDAIAAWDKSIFDAFTAQNIYQRVEELKRSIEALPRLTLYSPVHLSSADVATIGQWCRAYVNSELMLDLRVDPSTVGGCAFAYNNTFHDISFSYFAEKERAALVKLVHDYGA